MKHEDNVSAWTVIRNAIQKGVYKIIARPVAVLVHIGVTPNIITLLSLVGNAAAAAIILANDTYQSLLVAGVVILLSSSLDMVDGYMARTYNLASTFGAFLDSVVDRYSELITLSAIAVWTWQNIAPWATLVTFLALIGSVMVSYARARAEGLGADCKVGFMQRPERVVLTALSLVAGGIFAQPLIVAIAMAIIAVASNLTAIWRVIHVHRVLNTPVENASKNAQNA